MIFSCHNYNKPNFESMSFYIGPNTPMSFTGKLLGRLRDRTITVNSAVILFTNHCVSTYPGMNPSPEMIAYIYRTFEDYYNRRPYT